MEKLNFLLRKNISSLCCKKAKEIADKRGLKIGSKIKSVKIRTVFGREDVFTTQKGLNYNSSLIFVNEIIATISSTRVGYYEHCYFPEVKVFKSGEILVRARFGGISFPVEIDYLE